MNTNTTTTENTKTENTKTIEELYADKTAAELVELLNKTEDKTAFDALLKVVEDKLKDENKLAVKAAITAFAYSANADVSAFWDGFIRKPYVTVSKLAENKETGEFSIESAGRRVQFSKIDAAYQEMYNGETIANAKNYLRMIARITDNLYRATCTDLSKDLDRNQAVIKVAAKIDGETTMRNVDFTKTSNGGICEQMQAFVDTVLPDGQRVLLRNADVNYIRLSVANGKNGKVVTGKETMVENLIFDAIAKRYTQTAYEVESKAAIHKADKPKKSDRSEKQEEATSKIPERPEAEATLSKKSA